MTAPLVDAHLHLWRRQPGRYAWLRGAAATLQRDFTVEDADAVLAESGVHQVILVQAEDSLADTEDMLAVSLRAPWVAGVVGWVHLDRRNARDELVRWAQNGLFRGVRHLVHNDPRDEFLDLPEVRRSLRAVAELGLVFEVPDAWPRHLGAAGRIARAIPELTVVIDHLAKPPSDADAYAQWLNALRVVAAEPNTVAKVSGLYGSSGPMPAGLLRRVWNDALDAFGPRRLLWGSDWPMSIPHGGYRVSWQAVQPLISLLSPNEQDEVCGRAAQRVYAIRGVSPTGEIGGEDSAPC